MKTKAILALIAFFVIHSTYTLQENWFQTWDRPEYLEWATSIPERYKLLIIRQEENNYLTVKAKLLMSTSKLPGFEVVETINVPEKEQALQQIKTWQEERASLLLQDEL